MGMECVKIQPVIWLRDAFTDKTSLQASTCGSPQWRLVATVKFEILSAAVEDDFEILSAIDKINFLGP